MLTALNTEQIFTLFLSEYDNAIFEISIKSALE